MQDHLDRDALERLVHRRCHASRAYGWLLHLLACTECRERVVRSYPGKGERFLREIFRTREPLRPPDLDDQDRLDRVLADLQTHGLAEYLQEGDVPSLLADFHRHPPARQRLILDNTQRLWNLSTVEYLFERCEREFHRDPRYGQHLAELALSVLDRLSPDHYHPRLLYDLKGRAWGLRGNFLRIREQTDSAEQDFKRASKLLESGTGDADERLRHLNYCASLAAEQRRFQRSIDIGQSALKLSQDSGNRGAELVSVVNLVHVLQEAGRYQEAIRLGEGYLEQVSLERDGWQALLALHGNLALALSKGGRGLPAYRLHQNVLDLLPADQPRFRTKSRWQQVRVFESLGCFDLADSVAHGIANEVLTHLGRVTYGTFLVDRARLALRRRDPLLARSHGREACQIFEQAGSHTLAETTSGMMAGGPLIYP